MGSSGPGWPRAGRCSSPRSPPGVSPWPERPSRPPTPRPAGTSGAVGPGLRGRPAPPTRMTSCSPDGYVAQVLDPVGRPHPARWAGVPVRRHEYRRRAGATVRNGARRDGVLPRSPQARPARDEPRGAWTQRFRCSRPPPSTRTPETVLKAQTRARRQRVRTRVASRRRHGTSCALATPGASQPNTEMELTGPAAGHPLAADIRRSDRPQRAGHVQQLRQRQDAVGTYLTCEENFNGYFGTDESGSRRRH